jgi:hypothetical protein
MDIIRNTTTASVSDETELSIPKPATFDLDQFTSDGPTMGVKRLPMALTVRKFSDLKDFGRLHPDDAYWSKPLALVGVPVAGERNKVLHLIRPDLAESHLPAPLIIRRRLALGSDPDGKLFLCEIPCDNLDNAWNKSNLEVCEIAKTRWVRADSKNAAGLEGYEISFPLSAKAFREPEWPVQPLGEIISLAFKNRTITAEDHPALLRLIGAEQQT